MAYSPFGGILGRTVPGKNDAPPLRADNPYLVSLASKYNKTVPQILLRYLVGILYSVITTNISLYISYYFLYNWFHLLSQDLEMIWC